MQAVSPGQPKAEGEQQLQSLWTSIKMTGASSRMNKIKDVTPVT